MNNIHANNKYNLWIIWISFMIAGILQIIPYSLQYLNFPQPSWLNLFLIYWITQLPERMNIGTSFLIGLITDIISGTTLGVSALSLTILSYLLIIKFPLFYNIHIWKQGFIIILYSCLNHLIIFTLLNISMNNIIFSNTIFLDSVIDGIMWPLILFLMNKIRYH